MTFETYDTELHFILNFDIIWSFWVKNMVKELNLKMAELV